MAERMRRRAGALAVAALAGSLPGCLSPVPLDPTPQADLDPRLVGAWRCMGPGMAPDDETMDLVITRTRERVYAVTFDDTGDETPDRFEVHASRVGERTIVNARSLSSDKDPWDFAAYEFLRPEVLLISLAGSDAFEHVERTPAALRARMLQPAAFSDFCVCVPLNKE